MNKLHGNAKQYLTYILAKLPQATEKELGILASFICGLRLSGWADDPLAALAERMEKGEQQ